MSTPELPNTTTTPSPPHLATAPITNQFQPSEKTPIIQHHSDGRVSITPTLQQSQRAQLYYHNARLEKKSFFKRPGFRNAMVYVPIIGFVAAVTHYSGTQVQQDFTKDPLFPEVLAEIKREELLEATKHLDAKINSRK